MTHANNLTPSGYALFHCNLAFSSIAEHAHEDVIETCYWPLLELAGTGLFFPAIELTAFTLECIQKVDPSWIDEFKSLLEQGKCELIGSGDSQIIGPLVPARVNDWNQQLGIETYQSMLGQRPNIAYVNEQAISSGLIDIYIDHGYRALIVEWDNLYSNHSTWRDDYLHQPQRLLGLTGRSIPVLWNWSIAFQKLQRVCHGQLSTADYFDFIQRSLKKGITAMPIYGNDTEIFDYRPGRFKEEPGPVKQSEWLTLREVFSGIRNYLSWKTPSQILTSTSEFLTLDGFTPEHPISVKKQRKYNLTRWCLSGRNDLILNTVCHRKYANLTQMNEMEIDAQKKQALCRLWASDFRTHLHQSRYARLLKTLKSDIQSLGKVINLSEYIPCKPENCSHVQVNQAETRLTVDYNGVHLVLNLLRGGTIKECSFHSNPPVIGTIDHGDSRHIALAADFYSNHVIAERINERQRVTDLEPCSFQLFLADKSLMIVIQADFDTSLLTKTYRIHSNGKLDCGLYFQNLHRHFGTMRLGFITLLSRKIEHLLYACHNGGHGLESFNLSKELDHGQAVSSFITASGCLGATEGELFIHDGDQGLRISWSPQDCAAIPMVQRQLFGTEQLNRFFFSLAEGDETFSEDGSILNFEYTLEQSNDWPQKLENKETMI